ncbi:uncharacterized protein LOC134399549 [Elgaria multicarinata webbii]|uniref:uncharacterized protein LOC134399549 n=1 Tax=Elgaria multicarinata webbii TaxID=159646 RepID=UPI002FCD0DC5
MDILLDDDASSVPQALTVTRTKAKNVRQLSPLQELEDKSLIVDHYGVVLTNQAQPANGDSASVSLQLSNSAASHSADGTIVPRNQPLWSNNETGYSSFLEMYESADEHCSWNNVTIADLYPGMVKALSILLHKVSRKAASSSLMKRYRYGYWHSKKTTLNTSTERIRKSRPLKLKSSLRVTKGDGQRHKLPIANNESNHSFDDNKHQMKCSVNNISSICYNADIMDIDSSGIVEDHSYAEKVGQNGMETTIYPSDLPKDKTFLVRSPSFIPSDCVRKGKSFEEYSPIICPVDLRTTFNLIEDKTRETSNMTFKVTSCLSSSLSSSANSYLQTSKFSPVKSSDRLLGNHEIKMFNRAILLPRSHSFSSFPVNRSPIKVQQKCEDAFEKMYKELCSPKLQKPFKFSNICTSPKKSAELHTSGFNGLSSKFDQAPNDKFERIYQKLCSEGFPKIPTVMRAANLKKYEGIQMSETVNALVNSPVRTLPTVARIKRTANFCNEDFQSSPIKRLKNISEDSSYRICRELPYWKNINVQKSDMTFTLYNRNTNNWTSNVDSGFCVSSDHHFLSAPCTDMKESRIADADKNIPKCLLNCDFLKKTPNCTVGVSRKLSYNDRRVRNKNAYVEEFIRKDYNGSFLEGYGEEMYDFQGKRYLVRSRREMDPVDLPGMKLGKGNSH